MKSFRNSVAWLLSFSLLLLGFASCKDPFLYNLNEIRLNENERNLNAKNIEKLQAAEQKDTTRFILIGDSQRFYEEVDDFVEKVNEMKVADFVLLAGDITDFGLNKEYRWINQRLSQLSVPYLTIIGNHDMLANGRKVYREMFGPENFSFEYNGSKFICLNTNSLEAGEVEIIPDLPWLRQQLASSEKADHVFTISHIPPFDAGFNKELAKEYVAQVAAHNNVRMSLHGHQHQFSHSNYYQDGVEYVVAGSMNKRSFVVITAWSGGHKVEEVNF